MPRPPDSIGALRLAIRAAIAESRRHAGSRTVVYSRRARIMLLLGVILTGSLLGAVLASAPAEPRTTFGLALGAMLLLTIYLTLEYFATRITYDEQGIHVRTVWRRHRSVPFAAVTRCDYVDTSRGYVIHAGSHGTISLSLLMRGVAELLAALPCPTPPYPPLDAQGRLVIKGPLECIGQPPLPRPEHPFL